MGVKNIFNHRAAELNIDVEVLKLTGNKGIDVILIMWDPKHSLKILRW